MLCTGELGDVDRLIAGAQVTVPDNYVAVQMQARDLQTELKKARQPAQSRQDVRNHQQAEENEALDSIDLARPAVMRDCARSKLFEARQDFGAESVERAARFGRIESRQLRHDDQLGHRRRIEYLFEPRGHL